MFTFSHVYMYEYDYVCVCVWAKRLLPGITGLFSTRAEEQKSRRKRIISSNCKEYSHAKYVNTASTVDLYLCHLSGMYILASMGSNDFTARASKSPSERRQSPSYSNRTFSMAREFHFDGEYMSYRASTSTL